MEKYLVVFGKWRRDLHAVIFHTKITNDLFEHKFTKVDVDTLHPGDLYPVFKYDCIDIHTRTLPRYDIMKDIFEDNIVDFVKPGRDMMKFITQRMVEWKFVDKETLNGLLNSK